MIVRVGEENGLAAAGRHVVWSRPKRYRPGASEVMALRVGHEKLTRWDRKSAEGEHMQHDPLVRGTSGRWIGRRLDDAGCRQGMGHWPPAAAGTGSHLVERLRARAASVRRQACRLRPDTLGGRRAVFDEAEPDVVFHLAGGRREPRAATTIGTRT